MVDDAEPATSEGAADIGGLEREVGGAADATATRDELVSRVTDHAGRIARELAILEGGDYGRESFDTDGGTWTVKYEAGNLEFLLFEPKSGPEVYVVSTKQPPEPSALANAMADYDDFVTAFNDSLEEYGDVLSDVDPEREFPAVATTDELVAKRDRLAQRIRAVADEIAAQLHRFEDGYGTYATTVDGTRWELKWDEDRASYLRVGGEGGVYLVSQYDPPSPTELRRYVDEIPGFVETFNEYVEGLDADLAIVSLERPDRE